MMRLAVVLVPLFALTACAERFNTRSSATPLPFNASLAKGDDPREFIVKVVAGTASVAEVRESVRFPATRYCVTRFGSSDVGWTTDDAGEWGFVRDADELTFSGRCLAR